MATLTFGLPPTLILTYIFDPQLIIVSSFCPVGYNLSHGYEQPTRRCRGHIGCPLNLSFHCNRVGCHGTCFACKDLTKLMLSIFDFPGMQSLNAIVGAMHRTDRTILLRLAPPPQVKEMTGLTIYDFASEYSQIVCILLMVFQAAFIVFCCYYGFCLSVILLLAFFPHVYLGFFVGGIASHGSNRYPRDGLQRSIAIIIIKLSISTSEIHYFADRVVTKYSRIKVKCPLYRSYQIQSAIDVNMY